MLTRLQSIGYILLSCILMLAAVAGYADAQPTVADNGAAVQTDLFAESSFDLEEQPDVPEFDMKSLMLRVVLMLGLMIAGIVGVVWVLKRFLGGKETLFSKQERYLQVVDRMYLDHKKVVYLIKILDEILVVGATNEQLNMLDKITDEKKVEALASRDFAPLMSLFHNKMNDNKGQK